MLRALALILFLLPLSLSVLAQVPQSAANQEKPDSPRGGMISGRVVDETGQPIVNAVVYVQTRNAPNAHTANTDREGAFQVGTLEPGAYFVSANAPAYITPPPEARKPPSLHSPGDSVTVTLFKGAAVTGKVMNAAGDPVVGIAVRVQIVRDPEGRVYPANSRRGNEVSTDDRGVYRVYGLMSGTYIVSAGGPSELSRVSMFVNPFDNDIATYAPSSSRQDAAEITVRAGEEASGVDIRYRAEQGRSVRGEVKAMPDTNFGVTLTAREGSSQWHAETSQSSSSPGFIFTGVPDGDYDIYAQSYSNQGDRGVSEHQRINVRGADVEGIVLTAKPFAAITGRVVVEETTVAECTDKERPPFREMGILASHNETAAAKRTPQAIWSMSRSTGPNAEGHFGLQDLAAGEYVFGMRIWARYWYLRSVTLTPPAPTGAKAPSRPVDATRVWTNLKSGDKVTGLTLTLAHGAALLSGRLEAAEGEQVPARMVVYLVPVERERADDVLRFFASRVSPEGAFRMDHIPPGRYWILAQASEQGQQRGQNPYMPQVRLPNEGAMRLRLRREAEALKNEIEFKPCQEVGHFKLPLKPAVQ